MTKSTKRTLTNFINDLVDLGWTADAARRYFRAVLKKLPTDDAVAAIADLVGEELQNHVAYCGAHAPLLDDQLEHTLPASSFA